MSALRPSEADRLARHLLIDEPGDVPGSVTGLIRVLDAVRQRSSPDPDGVGAIVELSASVLTQLVGRRAWSLERSSEAMVRVAEAVLAARSGTESGRGLGHVAFLVAHATAKSAAAAGEGEVLRAVRAVELGLDAALHRRPGAGGGEPKDTVFSSAVSQWARAVRRSVQEPSVMAQLATARAAGMVVVAVDAITQRQVSHGSVDTADYVEAIQPALASSLRAWGQQHCVWTRLLSPGQHLDPDLMDATATVIRACREAAAEPRESRSWDTAVTALSVTRHVAAMTNHGIPEGVLKAPAESVAEMLAAVSPPKGTEVHPAWLELERLEGRAMVTVPTPVLGKLQSVGNATVRAQDRAVRSSYLMMGASAAVSCKGGIGPIRAMGEAPCPRPAPGSRHV